MEDIRKIFEENAGAGQEIISQKLAEAGITEETPMSVEPQHAGKTAFCLGCNDEVTADAEGRCPYNCGAAFSVWAAQFE